MLRRLCTRRGEEGRRSNTGEKRSCETRSTAHRPSYITKSHPLSWPTSLPPRRPPRQPACLCLPLPACLCLPLPASLPPAPPPRPSRNAALIPRALEMKPNFSATSTLSRSPLPPPRPFALQPPFPFAPPVSLSLVLVPLPLAVPCQRRARESFGVESRMRGWHGKEG